MKDGYGLMGDRVKRKTPKYKRMLLMWEAVGQEGFISLVFSYRVLYAHLEARKKRLGVFEESLCTEC